MGVTAFTAVLRKNIPQAVELAVLGKKMLPAKMFRVDIPDAHILKYNIGAMDS